MKCDFVDIESCELEFFLFEKDVDDKMKTKLKKLGFPNIWVQYPSNANNKLVDLGGGIFQQGDFQCSSFPVDPTADAKFAISYNEGRNSISLKLEGTFFIGNDSEVYGDDDRRDFMRSRTEGIIQSMELNNDKGKIIKKSKDAWGNTLPIEALAADLEYNGKGHGLRFRIHTKSGIYRDGEVVNG